MVSGVIRKIASGAGFLIPHDAISGDRSGDIYISAQDLGDAQTGDEVLIRLLKRRRGGGQRCGRVEEVIERATNLFVGTYLEKTGSGYVQVDGTIFNEAIYVGDPGAKGAKVGDKVVIEMLRFPSHFQIGEGVLTEVLGPRGAPGVDTLSIIHEYGLPVKFPPEVMEEARDQVDQFNEQDLDGRLDLTKETIVTIDPADARDFDDAISLKRTKDGHWHLGVHIADVAHFVAPGSQLDREAQLRGNSVYLPRHVIPMLPETISNGLASLQEGKVRYTKSTLIEFNPEGIPIHTEFANSAIKVTKRFAYEEVLPILDNSKSGQPKVAAKARSLLQRMYDLAMILRKRRFAAGALELHMGEVELDFDEDARVTGAHEREHDESHQIIEEFMLAANIAVATKLNDLELPFLRRVHADPDYAKLKAYSEFVDALGFDLPKFQSKAALQELLNAAEGTPLQRSVNYGLLRSLKQAEYTPREIGHYALAVGQYCHFTSPIRRYPDLIIHRLVGNLVTDPNNLRYLSEVELIKLGKSCSLTERRAAEAERELTKIKLLAFLADQIGMRLEASITGVEPFGLFCQGVELPVEGLVHISHLTIQEPYDYDRATFSLLARRSGTQYRLGDLVTVEVTHVDVDRRVLDLRLVNVEGTRRMRAATSEPETSGSPRRQRPESSGKKSTRNRKKGTTAKKGSKRANKKSAVAKKPAKTSVGKPAKKAGKKSSTRKKTTASAKKKTAHKSARSRKKSTRKSGGTTQQQSTRRKAKKQKTSGRGKPKRLT